MNKQTYQKQSGGDAFKAGVGRDCHPVGPRTSADHVKWWLIGWDEASAKRNGVLTKGENK